MKRSVAMIWIVPCAASALMACGGGAATSQPAKAPEDGPLSGELTDAEGKPAPKWVTQPAKYRKDDDGNKVVCAEGSIGGTASMSMAQTASAGRARTALARNLETKVVAMLKDYQSTTTGGAQFKSAANDEQHVQDASKQITNTTLSGTEVTDTWISKTSTMHSLVCLNVERFKGAVSGMKQLDEQIRQAVVQRAEKAWDELDAVDGQAAPPPQSQAAPPQTTKMAAKGHGKGRTVKMAGECADATCGEFGGPSNAAEEKALQQVNRDEAPPPITINCSCEWVTMPECCGKTTGTLCENTTHTTKTWTVQAPQTCDAERPVGCC